MATDDSEPSLSAFQLEAARLFFSLPASRGFPLAGGAALLAQHLTARPTEDLDFFTAPERGHVLAARDALEAAARQRGWSVQRIHDSDTFCRMVIRSTNASVLIDLAVNAPPDLPASDTPAGPTLAPEELAGHKLLALLTGLPHATSPTCTFWRVSSVRGLSLRGPARSMRASTPQCSPT
ncbi:MAG: nucleotidyl transferase AbiEii/AbiGii toxin family protein [Trebonia sp.]